MAQLLHDSYTQLIFTPFSCYLQGPSLKRPVDLGKLHAGLYLLQCNTMNSAILCTCKFSFPHFEYSFVSKSCAISPAVWHYRLGHLPIHKLCILGLDSTFNKSSFDSCIICAKAKQTKLPFSLSTSNSLHPFSLVHLDIWGPYHTATFKDCRYFLTIVDDYSRTTLTHLISHKSSAFTIIKAFVSMVKTQFSTTVKCFRSDNAMELGCSKEVSLFFQQ